MSGTLDNYELSCELWGHSKDVRAVAAGTAKASHTSMNDEVILSGSRDKTVKVWKDFGNSYCEKVTLQEHSNFVAAVYYSTKNNWICTGSNDATINVYNAETYILLTTLKDHESTVCSIASGIQPHTIISGSWDKTARVWSIDPHGGYRSFVLRGHEAAVWAVASILPSERFVTGSADKCILLWNIQGDKLLLLKGHNDCVRGLLVLSDNSLVSCANDAVIRVWNAKGESVQELNGHTNYIYALAQNKSMGDNVIVSCGEDSSLRMWDIQTGNQLGEPILHPAQSVWSVACLKNGDIVTGSSDGLVRIFTKDPNRFATEEMRKIFKESVEVRLKQLNEQLGGFKRTDLPGIEALLNDGNREGQTKMVRHTDGSVKCYIWQQGKWNLVGDVMGASGGTQATSGKILHEGKEYDFVFSVDISDTMPPLKLPYNHGQDPWQVAQTFIHCNHLPQAYLDQVAKFIVKNSGNGNSCGSAEATHRGLYDPFTGDARYVPGGNNNSHQLSGNTVPFTGQEKFEGNLISKKHFPHKCYITFDCCDHKKVLAKLKEFNSRQVGSSAHLTEEALNAFVKMANNEQDIDSSVLTALPLLLRWPCDMLFPVIDILRLAMRNEKAFQKLNSMDYLKMILNQISSSVPNQLMIIRCLANVMVHESGRHQVELHLPVLMEHIIGIKMGTANLQIAIATFYLNLTVWQTSGVANASRCRIITEGIIEILKWASDLEACYRILQAIGNLTTTNFKAETVLLIVSSDEVMTRIRKLTHTPQTGIFVKLNSAASELLALFE